MLPQMPLLRSLVFLAGRAATKMPPLRGFRLTRRRLGVRRCSAAFSPATTMRKRQSTGAVQNLAAEIKLCPEMNAYLDALNAMHDLLGALGEKHWRSWIAQDINEWESRNSVRHHLSAYGGMGSFNDLLFEDVWLGTLFDDLKSLCYALAQRPTEKPNMHALERSLGSYCFELSGWRCLACGHSVVSNRDIEYFVARRIIRNQILREAERCQLKEYVRSVIRSRPVDPELTTENVAEWAGASGLQIRAGNDWLCPCPACGSNDTAVYRWLLVNERGFRFVPSHDNLPLRFSTA